MTQSPVFSAVLFDCDGVLVDSEPITNGVLREMLHELGWQISAEDCVRLFIGRALKDEWRVIYEHTGVHIDEAWLEQFRDRRNVRLREELEAIPGALTAVTVVRDRFEGRIACASGADRVKINLQLERTGLASLFGDMVFSGMECPHSKPAPDVYLAAAQALGVDAGLSLVVEDTVAGVTAGVAAGATVIGLSRGEATSTNADELLAAGAAHVMSNMAELPAAIDALEVRAGERAASRA